MGNNHGERVDGRVKVDADGAIDGRLKRMNVGTVEVVEVGYDSKDDRHESPYREANDKIQILRDRKELNISMELPTPNQC